jgi:hypothetical protein
MIMPNTKYFKLQNLLKEELQSGKFQVGDRFYTEKEIMRKYHVSSVTAARTLSEMTQQGYFERKRKLGTFVLGTRTIPGMSGEVMTCPLYINQAGHEEAARQGPSWFLVEEIRRGIINAYPGMVKILPMDEIIRSAEQDPGLLTILFPQRIEFFAEKYQSRCPANTIEILLPPNFGSPVNCVRPDYMMGVFDAVSHLIHLGHRRIVYIGSDNARYRYAAYRIALETHRLEMFPELVIRQKSAISSDDVDGYADRLLRLPADSRPTAVFCDTDRVALWFMEAVGDHGLSVPDDISVIGFDNIPESETAPVPLSTVRVPYYEIGKTAVEVLMEKIKTGCDLPPRMLPAVYVMRKSAGPVKGKHP